VLWVPLGLAHVVALLFDRYAQIGVLDLIIPFGVSYGRVAIGLGTISFQLILIVLISTWLRSSLTVGQWRGFHRLSYIAFAAAFAHGIMSGTDLANPVVASLAWITAAAVALVALRRVTRVRLAA
jgi:sulfoxide reductase heme-binding subunit YedZ